MEVTLSLVLGIIAVLLLTLHALGVEASRVSLGWLGLALWALVVLILAL